MSYPQSAPSPAAPNREGWGARLANRLAIFGFLALTIGPLWLPREIAAWHAAAAQEHAWSGRHDEAIQGYTRALAWYPECSDYLVARAQQYQALDQGESALADARRAYQINLSAAGPLSVLLVKNGQPSEAARLWRDLLQEVRESESPPEMVAMLQNSLAYHLALADEDLQEAHQLAEQAVAFVRQRIESERSTDADESELEVVLKSRHCDTLIAYLDTRGYANYKLGRYQEARKDLDEVITLLDRSWINKRAKLRERSVTVRHLRRNLSGLHYEAAVLYYHRALVLKALGLKEEANRDEEKIRQLGLEPSDALF